MTERENLPVTDVIPNVADAAMPNDRRASVGDEDSRRRSVELTRIPPSVPPPNSRHILRCSSVVPGRNQHDAKMSNAWSSQVSSILAMNGFARSLTGTRCNTSSITEGRRLSRSSISGFSQVRDSTETQRSAVGKIGQLVPI